MSYNNGSSIPTRDPGVALPHPTPHARPAALRAQTIGERLRSARLAAGMTQQELAGGHFSKGYISAIERGAMFPSVPALTELTQRLGVPVGYLLGESDFDLRTLAGRPRPQPPLSPQERAEREAAAMRPLAQAEALLRQDKPGDAWEYLGTSGAPPANLTDEQKTIWYWLAGWAAIQENRHSEANGFLETGLPLAEQLRDQAGPDQQRARAERVEWLRCFMAVLRCSEGKTYESLNLFRQGLNAIGQGIVTDAELALWIYKGLGNAYLSLGVFQEAITYYALATKRAENIDNARQRGLAWWGLGLSHQKSGDLENAKESYITGLRTFGEAENLRLVATLRALLGQLLTNLKDFAGAEKQLRQSLEGAKRFEDHFTAATAWQNLASLFIAKKQPDQAIEAVQKGIAIAQQIKQHQIAGQGQLTLASAYQEKGDQVAQEQAISEAITSFEQVHDLDMLSLAHERLGELLKEQGRYQEAFAELHLARTLPTAPPPGQ